MSDWLQQTQLVYVFGVVIGIVIGYILWRHK